MRSFKFSSSVLKFLKFGKESSTVTSLGITQALGVLKLGAKRDFVLAKSSNGSLNLINLTGKVLVLNLKLLPGGVSLIQSTCHVVQLDVGFNNECSSELAIPLMVGTVPHCLIKTATSLLQVTFHTSLTLLRHIVVVFLPQSSQSSFMSNVGLIKLSLEFSQFSFSLLVEFNLSGSVIASILKFLSKISNVS